MRRMMHLTTIALLLVTALGVALAQNRQQEARDHYTSGRSEVEHSNWDEAIRHFDRVIRLGAGSEDGAHYWKAYAHYKDGRSREALETLAARREAFPDGRWSNDARALELEINESAGRPVNPDAEQNLELKLIALNALIHADQDRAIPMIEKILRESSSLQMKEQALFVLVQSGSPRAREILLDVAQGGLNPDLQLAALQHMGMFGEHQNIAVLKEIYATATDRDVRQAILMSYGMAGATDELLEVIETEDDHDLRREALMHLGHAGGGSELVILYDRLTGTEDRVAVLEALAMSGESDKLKAVARSEDDPRLRRVAIQSLGFAGGHDTASFLVGIYGDSTDRDTKDAVLESLMMQGAASALIEIARGETDLEVKKRAVQMLAMMESSEATEYLIGILDE